MDKRAELIDAVMEMLASKVDVKVMDAVQDAMTLVLQDYDVSERCTDVAVVDNTWERLLKRYIATKRSEGASEKTVRRYFEINSRMLRFIGKPVDEITAYDLRFYISFRRDKSPKKSSNRTLDGERRCFSAFFGWLRNEAEIAGNPCASIGQIKYRKEIKKPYSPVEMEKLKQACSTKRDLAMVEFLYSTGCRVSEVERLNIEDVDFEHREVKVIGKGDKERIVYLTEVAVMRLEEYLSERKGYSEALFTGKGTERIKKNGIEATIKRIGDIAGIEGAHPHRFRRTLATNLLDKGMSIQYVASILGHADLTTTQIYCYISQSNVRTEYQKYSL